MRSLTLLFLGALAFAAEPAQDAAVVTIAPFEKDRRWVSVEAKVKVAAPFHAADEKGNTIAAQGEGNTVRLLLPFIPAGEKTRIAVKTGTAKGGGISLTDDPAGFISVKGGDREITRYYTGSMAEKHKKPFFRPLSSRGVNLLRGYPVTPKEGEPADHPHHTGLYFCFGEVNGKEYWSKTAITPKSIVKKEQGPAGARLVAENAWGEDLAETQDILILNAGEDVVMDWTITLKASNGPVVFAKDIKMAKEGAFAARLTKELSFAKGDAPEMILDARGDRGEKAARANGSPWVDYSGEVDGKKVGISILNHPSSFRYPSDWHVRAYGLFAANPWIIKGENTIAKGESLVLKWRVYVHGGDAAAGKVADVFAGYANAQATAE
ncbi:MAG: PmoA family protein [Planctomycetes bacterium]|nr:PmoA family protein [Planctomycetota bacterium]